MGLAMQACWHEGKRQGDWQIAVSGTFQLKDTERLGVEMRLFQKLTIFLRQPRV